MLRAFSWRDVSLQIFSFSVSLDSSLRSLRETHRIYGAGKWQDLLHNSGTLQQFAFFFRAEFDGKYR